MEPCTTPPLCQDNIGSSDNDSSAKMRIFAHHGNCQAESEFAFTDADYRYPDTPRLKRFRAIAYGLGSLRGRYEPPNTDIARRVASDLKAGRPISTADVAIVEAAFAELLYWMPIISRNRRELMLAAVLKVEQEEQAARGVGRAT